MLAESEGGKIKPANYQMNYTPEQMLELWKCERDVLYFIENYVMIQHPTRGAIKFQLFEFQKRLLKVYQDNPRVIAMLSRQVGKTQTAAAFLLWWACFKRDQTILIASKDQSGADEIMERLHFSYEELPFFLKPGLKKNDVRSKYYDNGSKIRSTATTKTSGRGKSNSLIYLDEFAFARPSVVNEFWTSIYPTLSTGGRCIITSTPNTDEDKFARIWFNSVMAPESDSWEDKLAENRSVARIPGDEEVYTTYYENEDVKKTYQAKSTVVKATTSEDSEVRFVGFHAHWTSVPNKWEEDKSAPNYGEVIGYRDERFKEETIAAGLTEEEWLREFECSFISGDSTLISGTKLATLRFTVRPPRFIDKWGCRWYEEILPNTPYAVVLDPSGDGIGDDACIQVWELPSLIQVAEWNSNLADQNEQTKMLRRVLTRIYRTQNEMPDHYQDGIYYSVERVGLGIGIIRAIEHEGEDTFPGWMLDSTETSANVRSDGNGKPKLNRWRGLLTSTANKKRYCLELKSLIERNLFIPRSEFLASQLKNFVKRGGSYAAKEGSRDDIVMAAVLMCMLIDEVRFQEPEVDDYIRPALLDDYSEDDETHPDNMPMLPSF